MNPVDFLGRPINAGDVIVYPVRRGSEMWLNKLNVTQTAEGQVRGYSSTGRLLVIKNLRNTVVVGKQQAEPAAAPVT